MGKDSYLVRYVCASKNDKPRREACHRFGHLAMATSGRDVIQ